MPLKQLIVKSLAVAVVASIAATLAHADVPARKIGVLFVVHGGSETPGPANTFDNALQFFQYDPNSAIFRNIIWNPEAWPQVLRAGDSESYANTATQLMKYRFQNARIGGRDPSNDLIHRQFTDMTRMLAARGKELGVEFVTDMAHWLGSQTHIDRLPWPRHLYYPKVPGGSVLDYCGSAADGGPWPDCDPRRYDVDGPGERLLKQGVSEIVMVDMTVAGVRFWKSYDVVTMTRRMVADWNAKNGTDVRVRWVNDPTDLMTQSHPVDPPNWTRALGPPKSDVRVPLEGRPNPLIEDPLLTDVMVDGIVKAFNPKVRPKDTAVMFINHATRDGNETFDPKMNDTVVLDALIKDELLRRYPAMKADNIIGSWMGHREPNPAITLGGRVRTNLERTREMRGEDLGSAWLYESDKELPGGDHHYRYWDALDLLRERGVKHIVVIFSQIAVDSVLNMVEVHNQIAKEIGTKTWLHAQDLDFATYPETGHPFASYWGIWVDTQCRIEGDPAGATGPCCLKLGGCADGRPYPPPRQTPVDQLRPDTDPSLLFDLPAYGHLGYDPARGAPRDDRPVQSQYRGTWALWRPANDDPRVGELLAGQVVKFIESRAAGAEAGATGDPER